MKHNAYATWIAGTLLAVAAAQGSTVAYWNFEDGVDGHPFNVEGADSGSIDTVGGILMRGYDSYSGPSFSSDNLFYNGLCMRVADQHQDGYVTEGVLHSWAPTNWTIECTVKLDDFAGGNYTFIGRDGSVFGDRKSDFYLQCIGNRKIFCQLLRTVSGQGIMIEAPDVSVKPGQWYGLAVISDGKTISLYIDDRDGNGYELEGSAPLYNTPAGNALAGSTFNWTFGRGWYDGNYTDRINGAMDNIRFSDTALKPAELIPVRDNPFLITYAPPVAASGPSQTIEVTIVDEDSDLGSAELLLDGTPVATNNAPSGTTNSVSFAAEKMYAGTHHAAAVIQGFNPSVTVTQHWSFTVVQAPVDCMTEGAIPGKWTMDLEAAQQTAAEKKLPILLDFSGSDWCSWCKLMEKDVFTEPEWKEYAAQHLMMVLIDFPNDRSLVPDKYVARNQALNNQFKISGYPTYVVLDDDGETELGRLGAGRDKTPESFIAELTELLRFRTVETEAYIKTLSPEDKTAYLSLLNRLEQNKLAKQQTQEELEALMTKAQLKMVQVGLTEQWLNDDLRRFRITQRLDPDKRRSFESVQARLQMARNILLDWMALMPDESEENGKLYTAFNQLIKDFDKELAQYEEQ